MSWFDSTTARCAVILGLTLASGAVPAESRDCLLEEVELAVEPAQPTTADDIELVVSGYNLPSCGPGLVSWQREGSTIVVDGSWGGLCLPGLVPFELTVDLARLPKGTYEARFQIANDHEGCEYPPLLFEVVAGPAPPAPRSTLGASLLFPYFEVGLDGSSGATTAIAIGNGAHEPVIAHVVLWTDLGIPTLSFDLALPPNALETVDLRHVFAGRLPVTRPGDAGGDGCSDPVELPQADAAALTEFAARHSGRPSPSDGQCYGSRWAGESVATGFVTVDVANRCAGADLVAPGDPGYFGHGGSGLASNRAALWGDLLYIDDDGNNVSGLEAVALAADADLLPHGEETFYRGLFASNGEDNRTALPPRWRTRYLAGGSRGATTDLFIWLGSARHQDPQPCDKPLSDIIPCRSLGVRVFDEAGTEVDAYPLSGKGPMTARYQVGSEILRAPTPFGSIELTHYEAEACFALPTGNLLPLQAWVSQASRAQGRFSYAVHGVPVQAQ